MSRVDDIEDKKYRELANDPSPVVSATPAPDELDEILARVWKAGGAYDHVTEKTGFAASVFLVAKSQILAYVDKEKRKSLRTAKGRLKTANFKYNMSQNDMDWVFNEIETLSALTNSKGGGDA